MTTSFETQCIINAINAQDEMITRKEARQKERDREKRFKLGEERRDSIVLLFYQLMI